MDNQTADNALDTTELQVEGQSEEKSTFTKEEVAAMLQRESDRRVSQALDKQKRDYEKKLSLSSLDESQRKQAEKDLRIQELEEKIKDYTVLQNKSEVTKVLSARGLSAEFADIIAIGDNLDEAQSRIDSFDKLFKKAVQEEVKKRIASPTPKVGVSDELDKASFKKLTIAEKNKLYQENPELYNKLMKG